MEVNRAIAHRPYIRYHVRMADYISYLRSMVGHERVIMVACGAVIRDAQDRILLVRRTDEGAGWQFPGGYMELDETPEQTVEREVMEEIGLPSRATKLLSATIFDYTYKNGDAVHTLNLMYECVLGDGVARIDQKELSETGYFPLDAMPENFRHPEIITVLQKKSS